MFARIAQSDGTCNKGKKIEVQKYLENRLTSGTASAILGFNPNIAEG